MSNKSTNLPPSGMNGMRQFGRIRVVQKPKNMKGTLRRLWELTKGQRKGFGWILCFSAFTSASAILSSSLINISMVNL